MSLFTTSFSTTHYSSTWFETSVKTKYSGSNDFIQRRTIFFTTRLSQKEKRKKRKKGKKKKTPNKNTHTRTPNYPLIKRKKKDRQKQKKETPLYSKKSVPDSCHLPGLPAPLPILLDISLQPNTIMSSMGQAPDAGAAFATLTPGLCLCACPERVVDVEKVAR